jgi:hypothetical protein
MLAEVAAIPSLVIARSEATKQFKALRTAALDCFATLAMTRGMGTSLDLVSGGAL